MEVGIITGDVIGSSAIKSNDRKVLLYTINSIVNELHRLSPIKMDIFRGDSFQIMVNNPAEALKCAVLIRSGLKMNTPTNSENKWDARVAVGIGKVDYVSDNVVTSDGEAFRMSGHEFDNLGKKNLAISTPWNDINEELRVSSAFADDIITRWTPSQAQVIYRSILYDMIQKDIAAEQNQSVQNINKLLLAGKENLISLYLNRFKCLIEKKLK